MCLVFIFPAEIVSARNYFQSIRMPSARIKKMFVSVALTNALPSCISSPITSISKKSITFENPLVHVDKSDMYMSQAKQSWICWMP
jgi:uncharacterized membrane protein